jgi:hypothetical protein
MPTTSHAAQTAHRALRFPLVLRSRPHCQQTIAVSWALSSPQNGHLFTEGAPSSGRVAIRAMIASPASAHLRTRIAHRMDAVEAVGEPTNQNDRAQRENLGIRSNDAASDPCAIGRLVH